MNAEEKVKKINYARERLNKKVLTPWEEDFIESITDQLDAGKKLSERQLEILDSIYEKV
jgi:hypothetical protein